MKLTPMMEQWQNAKSQHDDAVVLFRMGDFYELFGDDALVAAPILDLAITSRDKDKASLPMAGFPFHAADNYIEKLVERGLKVAICEQLEDPKASRGLVKRGVTNVITPGTAIISESFEHSEPSYLVALINDGLDFAIASLDVQTGLQKVTTLRNEALIADEILRLAPKEIIVMNDDDGSQHLLNTIMPTMTKETQVRLEKRARPIVNEVHDQLSTAEKIARALVLEYLVELRGAVPAHLSSTPEHYDITDQLLLDDATRGNLDLVPRKRGDRYNLLGVLDRTKTAMGRRALRQSIIAPSTNLGFINARHDMVGELCNASSDLLADLTEFLSAMFDVEKLSSHVAAHKISPRGLAQLRDCLMLTAKIVEVCNRESTPAVKKLLATLPDISALRDVLMRSLADEPPVQLRDGGVFREGFDRELDETRGLVKNGQDLLLALEIKEREISRIPSLKIKYTRVFGYYIEITKTHLEKVPKHYQRKQTIANGERFTSEELSSLEVKLNSAEAQSLLIEEKRFQELLQTVLKEIVNLGKVGRVLAELDLLVSFAQVSQSFSWVRPQMLTRDARVLNITGGRHPVVEAHAHNNGSHFVANDVIVDGKENQLLLITGPNMAGKSTIMRQCALIQILAQMGSWVPAKSATLSITDAIFARVGASDDLSTGRSTFMVEMTETAAILHNATTHSLIILDEIGRGTSTYDGLSIARAVAEHIHDEVGARTLFATHYHELTELAAQFARVKNFHVGIVEKDQRIRFLYRLQPGACLKSFGIAVARLSGLPDSVLDRALAILRNLEKDVEEEVVTPLRVRPQLTLFVDGKDDSVDKDLVAKLREIDINRITPLQALNKLASLQGQLRKSERNLL